MYSTFHILNFYGRTPDHRLVRQLNPDKTYPSTKKSGFTRVLCIIELVLKLLPVRSFDTIILKMVSKEYFYIYPDKHFKFYGEIPDYQLNVKLNPNKAFPTSTVSGLTRVDYKIILKFE